MSSCKRPVIAGNSGANGLTLIELMITLLICSLALTIALPSFQQLLERERLIAAAETLAGQLQLAKLEALKNNRNVRLSFSVLNNETWCYGLSYSACNCWQANSCQLNGRQFVISHAEFPGISLTGTTTPWSNGAVFEPRRGFVTAGGATLSSAHFQIRVKTSNQGRIRICNDHSLQTKTDLGRYPSCN